MKRQGKLFKKISRKLAVFTTAMLVLQPLLMVGVMPQKAFAAAYDASVESFTLVNADTDGDIRSLTDGDIINLAFEDHLNIRANTDPGIVGSVKFGLDANPNYRNETAAPYALNGDTAGNYFVWTPSIGDHTVIATPYSGAGGTGSAGTPSTISFTVVNDSTDPVLTEVTPVATPTSDTTPSYTFNSTEAGMIYYGGDCYSGTGAAVVGDNTIILDELLEGVYDNCRIIVEDMAGNPSASLAISSFTIDLTSPTVVLSTTVSDPTNLSPFPVTAEFSEDVTGFDVSDVIAGNGTVGNFVAVDGNTYTFDITPSVEGAVTVDIAAEVVQDIAGNDNVAAVQLSVGYDGTDPVVIVDPLNTNDTTPTITGAYSDNSGEAEAGTAGVLVAEQNDVNIVVTIDGNDYDATINEDGTWSAEVSTEIIPDAASVQEEEGLLDGVYDIAVHAEDLAGNVFDQVFIGSLTVDTVAPASITDLKAVAGNGRVDLSWKNPTDSDFAGVNIVRTGSDGSSLTSATLATGEAYSDTTVTNGVTYTYDVYAVDNAGNESAKASASAAPVAPAISSASTSRVTSAISTETFKPKVDEAGEVKAAEITTDDKTDDQKDTEVKEEKKIPVWGILFLLILAAIGGYLFYVQNPENNGLKK